ncbi:MAG: hypothetical protein ACLTA5_09990 [Anaerococcus obesiensis]
MDLRCSFKRGHVIQKEDIEKLKDIGKENIFVGELDKGFVHEEDAIREVADDLIGENISYSNHQKEKLALKVRPMDFL